MKISIEDIEILRNDDGNFLNPRSVTGSVIELSDSILSTREMGLPDRPIEVFEKDGSYFILDGHRRYAAARKRGEIEIEAIIVKEPESPLLYMSQSFVRKNLSHLEWGAAFRELIERGIPLIKVAEMLGHRVTYVQWCLDLLSAPDSIKRAINSGSMSISAWGALKRETPDQQEQIMERVSTPTVTNIRKEIRKKQNKPGPILGLLAGNDAHRIWPLIGDIQTIALSNELTDDEKSRALESLRSIIEMLESEE
jgi:ParB/RepB/Spo0J family partition protein